MINISDNAAAVIAILCIGAVGALIGGMLAEGAIRLMIRWGWMPRRVIVLRMIVTEDQAYITDAPGKRRAG